VQRYGSGKLTLADIMQPAIELAEHGPPIAPVTAYMWKAQEGLLQSTGAKCMLNAVGNCRIVLATSCQWGAVVGAVARMPDGWPGT
jgi:hypothetical protein